MIQLRKYSALALMAATLAITGCKDEGPKENTDTSATTTAEPSVEVPASISYNIVNQYPHDTHAFTEGLEYRDGVLYESVGQYGKSDIRKVELASGKVLQATKMDDRFFGEGLTILNGKLYQLTYREGKVLVYNLASMKQEGAMTYPAQEGWGMTNNGTHLIVSDGSNKIYFMDPATMNVVKQLMVNDERGPVYRINELELINGYVYANQWQADVILKIDTATGRVVARADMASIRQQGGIPPNTNNEEAPETMNGIAWDATGNRIFVTGKNWPKIFEIKLDN